MGTIMACTSQAEQARPLPLTLWDKVGLAVLVLIVLTFGVLVEKRSAFMQRRMTDAGVYFRAAWAARTAGEIYHIADDNGWHFNYPPLLAILMIPLADAPLGEMRDGLLPYPTSIAIWFMLNLVAGLVAIHWLAKTLEETSPDPLTRTLPLHSHDWWARRVAPLLICLAPIAHTLMRGQVNLILLLLMAGMLRAMARGQNARAGAWLAGAICIKIIPAFLLLYPLWKRDWRFLTGCGAGLIMGLLVVPCLCLGVDRTVTCYHDLANGVLRPGLTQDGEATRAKELTNVTGTGSQSFVVVWHNSLYQDRLTRPDHADTWVRIAALTLGAMLALATVIVAGQASRKPGSHNTPALYVSWGALTLVMLFVSPISHMHYQTLCVPLVMGLLAIYPPRGALRWGWIVLGFLFVGAHVLPHLPGITELRDFGLAMYVGLLFWALAIIALRRTRKSPSEIISAQD
jgi:hypothetical protein